MKGRLTLKDVHLLMDIQERWEEQGRLTGLHRAVADLAMEVDPLFVQGRRLFRSGFGEKVGANFEETYLQGLPNPPKVDAALKEVFPLITLVDRRQSTAAELFDKIGVRRKHPHKTRGYDDMFDASRREKSNLYWMIHHSGWSTRGHSPRRVLGGLQGRQWPCDLFELAAFAFQHGHLIETHMPGALGSQLRGHDVWPHLIRHDNGLLEVVFRTSDDCDNAAGGMVRLAPYD